MVDGRRCAAETARRGFLAGLVALAGRPAWAEHPGLHLGIAPFTGSFRLAHHGDRLATFLEPCTGRTLTVRTAPDFRTFLARLLQRRYDLALAPVHFAAAAGRRDYLPVCDLDCGEGIVLFGRVPAGARPDLAAVRRASLLLPDPFSLVSLATLAELRRRGLRPAAVHHVRAARDVIELVEEGHAEMGAAPLPLYEALEAEERARGEPPVCVEIARFPVPLRKTLLLAPWAVASRRCLRAATERAFSGPMAPELGYPVRGVLDPEPRLYAELARLLPDEVPGPAAPAGGRLRG